jgi:hypothetical protein
MTRAGEPVASEPGRRKPIQHHRPELIQPVLPITTECDKKGACEAVTSQAGIFGQKGTPSVIKDSISAPPRKVEPVRTSSGQGLINRLTVRSWLESLQGGEPDTWREVRYIRPHKTTDTCGTFFQEVTESLLDEVEKMNSQGFGIYATLNPVEPDKAAKEPRLSQSLTTKASVRHRSFLLVDLDRKTKGSESATEADLRDSLEVATSICDMIASSFPDATQPAVICSGNGQAVIIPVFMANTEESTEAARRLLIHLNSVFCGDRQCQVDNSVTDASRVSRVPGTINTKFDGTSQAQVVREFVAGERVLTTADILAILPHNVRDTEKPIRLTGGVSFPERRQSQVRGGTANEKRMVAYIQPILNDIRTAPEGGKHGVLVKKSAKIFSHVAGFGLQHMSETVSDWIRDALSQNPSKVESWIGADNAIVWGLKAGFSGDGKLPADTDKANTSQASPVTQPSELVDSDRDLDAANVDHILARMRDRKWLWGDKASNLGWFVERGLHLVEGKEGTGKTRWLLDLCRRWSLDLRWPDGSKTEVDPDAKMLFVAADSHWDQIAETAVSFGIPSKNIIFAGTEDDPYGGTDIDDPQTIALLRRWLTRYKVGMVVIDTLMAASSRPLVDPQEVAQLAKPLRDLSREFGVPVVMVGHLNSQGETWGRSIGRTCDNVIRLESAPNDEQQILIKSVKARWNRFALPVLQGRQSETGWEYSVLGSDEGDTTQVKGRAAVEIAIKARLVAGGRASWSDLYTEMEGLGHKHGTIDRAIRALVSAGVIVKWEEVFPSKKKCTFFDLSPEK